MRRWGPASVAGLAFGFAALWVGVGPDDGNWVSFLAQLAGAEAVLLMAIAIVLISVLPAVETWFDGIDRTAIWHRRLSMTGVLLLIPHLLFATGQHDHLTPGSTPPTPGDQGGGSGGTLALIGVWGLAALTVWAIAPRWRDMLPWHRVRPITPAAGLTAARWITRACRVVFGNYERWRSLHRLTGMFLAAGFVHGLLDATMFDSGLLRGSYLLAGGTGLVFYLYRETLARHFLPLHDYQVTAARPAGPGILELELAPLGRPMHFTPGQFAMLFLETTDGWRRHPFTMSGAPADGTLTFAIKALGDDTTRIHHTVQPGMPAVIGGPHGRFDHARGTDRQVWIAGGIGVTPFLSWLRSLEHRPSHARVDFFYATTGPAPFADEITRIADGNPGVHVHLHDTTDRGYLTAADVLDAVRDTDPRQLSVFLCGPAPMVAAFLRQFRRAGIPARHLHREHFDWR
ncbi:hypothetical protein [Cryptosporangium phraense]|uniref:FAD-binding FR-type domain-containing protein n=1 Tax=Cryptosporangium phraense TaxID=2593070 RepID=A0A545AVX4_9ACTN|nr:hypothetical protein [Cryptosporangium phraense]TQS45464.1 hypothetical protein FL583_09405 [Cryptosporangium phraense]